MVARHRLYVPGFLCCLALLYVVEVYVLAMLPDADRPALLAAAVTLDLTLFVPLLYYLFLVRGKGFPLVSVAPVFLISLFAAEWIVPEQHQSVLGVIAWLAAPVELAVLGLVAVKAHRLFRQMRNARAEAGPHDDLLAVLQTAAREVTGNRTVARLLAFEIGAIYYAAGSWGKAAPRGNTLFSYHRKTNYPLILGGVLLLGALEVVVVHLLVAQWSEAAAWILTALSVYAFFWIIGDYRAAVLRPIRLTSDGLTLHTGLRWELHAPLAATDRLEKIKPHALHNADRETLDATLLGQPQYLLHLRRPLTAEGPYGIRKAVRRVRFAVDDAERFESLWRAVTGEENAA